MSDGLEILWILVASQVIAPVKAMNLPSFRPLTLTSVTRRPRGMYPDEWGVFGHGYSRELEYEETPAQLILRGCAGKHRNWNISVDLEDETIGHADWCDLTYYTYGGSADIGLMLFGLPSLILTSPLWLATNFFRVLVRFLTPLDLDSWVILAKLASQLSSRDRRALWNAFRRNCAGIENAHNNLRVAEYNEKIRKEKLAKQFANWKDDFVDGPFMLRLEYGTAGPEEIMNDVKDWERRQGVDQNVRVWEWLGMSEDEYNSWYKQEKTVLQLLEERNSNDRT